MYNYRSATTQDIPHMLAHLKRFNEFYGLKKHSFYSDDMGDMSTKLGNLISHHVCFVAEQVNDETGEIGEVVGLIGGMLGPHFYNKDLVILTEFFWWVGDEHRKSRVGFELIKKFIDVGKEKAHLISFCLLQNSPVKASSLEHFGFKPTEQSFLLEV